MSKVLFQVKNAALMEPSFTNYWVSRILSSTSFQMLSVAIGWQMYSLTHDAFSLGFVGLAQFIPMVLLTLVVGHAADRFDRRKIVFLCQITEGAIAALLLFGNISGWLGREQILLAAAVLVPVVHLKVPHLLHYYHSSFRKLLSSRQSHGVLQPDKRRKF